MISGTTQATQPKHLYLNANAKPGELSYAVMLCHHVDAARGRITNTQAHEAINALIASLFGVKAEDAKYDRPADGSGRYDNIRVNKWEINLDTLGRDLRCFKSLASEVRADLLEANAAYTRYSLLDELAAEGIAPSLDDTLETLGFESIEDACRTTALEINDLECDLHNIEGLLRDTSEWIDILQVFDTSLRSTAIALGYADALDTRDQPRIATVYSLPLSDGREVVAPLEVQVVLQDIFALHFGIGTPEPLANKYCSVRVSNLSAEDFLTWSWSEYRTKF